jgi:hypothetical protein
MPKKPPAPSESADFRRWKSRRQRRSDVVRMGGQHIRDGALYVRQQKTGAELIIPVHADLQAIISETPAMTFLVTEFGKPFTAAGFGQKRLGNQKPNLMVAPRAGFEPATNRLTAANRL